MIFAQNEQNKTIFLQKCPFQIVSLDSVLLFGCLVRVKKKHKDLIYKNANVETLLKNVYFKNTSFIELSLYGILPSKFW